MNSINSEINSQKVPNKARSPHSVTTCLVFSYSIQLHQIIIFKSTISFGAFSFLSLKPAASTFYLFVLSAFLPCDNMIWLAFISVALYILWHTYINSVLGDIFSLLKIFQYFSLPFRFPLRFAVLSTSAVSVTAFDLRFGCYFYQSDVIRILIKV